jgi:hypothetical protein
MPSSSPVRRVVIWVGGGDAPATIEHVEAVAGSFPH